MRYFLLLVLFAAISCNQKKKSNPLPPPSEANIVAVWTMPNGKKELNVLLRVIQKRVVFDSASGKDVITIDTVWGRPVYYPLKDSLGRAVLDSLGQPKLNQNPQYIKINKDSVSWKVENIPVEELLKKN